MPVLRTLHKHQKLHHQNSKIHSLAICIAVQPNRPLRLLELTLTVAAAASSTVIGHESTDLLRRANATLQDAAVLASGQWLGDHDTAIALLHGELVLDGGRAGPCASVVDAETSAQPVLDDFWIKAAGNSDTVGHTPASHDEHIDVSLGGTSDVGHLNISVHESLGLVNDSGARVSAALALLERQVGQIKWGWVGSEVEVVVVDLRDLQRDTLEDELLDVSGVVDDLICTSIVSVSISTDHRNLGIAYVLHRKEEGPRRRGQGSPRY
ncbi:hypothetical protein HII31_05428 [Pseudocercospora fuligena]|uniref:Uncharacterized protein n=1 Tax=Pseudocercospora fuligena TaxID=685502 RepID=A0A8H6RLM7_9PEZI|nr:hypothetical protein HII31_05428 [Pseudocercospora fuligena]